jgi:hypothetical protein
MTAVRVEPVFRLLRCSIELLDELCPLLIGGFDACAQVDVDVVMITGRGVLLHFLQGEVHERRWNVMRSLTDATMICVRHQESSVRASDRAEWRRFRTWISNTLQSILN